MNLKNLTNLNFNFTTLKTNIMSKHYDYYKEVQDSVEDFIKDEMEHCDGLQGLSNEELKEQLNDVLWVRDSVTGNGSGSYTFNSEKAKEYVCGNMELLIEAFEEFGCSLDDIKKGWEFCDVTIRCYILGECISKAVDKLFN